jgi:hypothetical protein
MANTKATVSPAVAAITKYPTPPTTDDTQRLAGSLWLCSLALIAAVMAAKLIAKPPKSDEMAVPMPVLTIAGLNGTSNP